MISRRVALKVIASMPLAHGLACQSAAAKISNEDDVVHASVFGVVSDGVSNDTSRLQDAIDRSVGKTLLIGGQCRIDTQGLSLRSGSRVRFEPGASIKLLAHDTPSYQMLRMWDVSDVVLENATLDGSRELNSAQPKTHSEGYGMGISIAGSSKITIKSATTVGCWGDGIYLANSYQPTSMPPQYIHVIDHHANNCRRQGISIISGRNVFIEGGLWENIGGTAPSAGLDIEPNSNRDVLENIRIVNPVTRNCKIGILVYLLKIAGVESKDVQIDISGQRDESAKIAAFSVSGLDTKGSIVKGRIVNRSATWIKPKLLSVESHDYDKRGPQIVVTNLKTIR